MATTSIANLWWVAGFVYALAGALLLCNAVFAGQRPSQQHAGSFDDYSLRRLGEQWLDARIGAVLMVIGFFLQATGAVGTPALTAPGALMLLALAFATGYYAMMRNSLAEELVSGGDLSLRGLLGTSKQPFLTPAPPASSETGCTPPAQPSRPDQGLPIAERPPEVTAERKTKPSALPTRMKTQRTRP
jgi:hypothetical protein